jgi:hypothetical protein
VEAAEERLRSMMVDEGARLYQPVLDAAEDLLGQLEAKELAHRSSLLRSGLMQREQRFAEECELVLRSGSPDLGAVEHAAKAVAGHRLAEVERGRAIPAAVEMAVRLLRWRNRRPAEKAALPQVVRGGGPVLRSAEQLRGLGARDDHDGLPTRGAATDSAAAVD